MPAGADHAQSVPSSVPVLTVRLDRLMAIPYREGGRDETGCDCWGFVRLVLARAGIAVPSFAGEAVGCDFAAEAALIARETSGPSWASIAPSDARPLDCVLMRMPYRLGNKWRAIENHVGVIVQAGRSLAVLHMMPEVGVSQVPLGHPTLRTRPRGFYRYAGA